MSSRSSSFSLPAVGSGRLHSSHRNRSRDELRSNTAEQTSKSQTYRVSGRETRNYNNTLPRISPVNASQNTKLRPKTRTMSGTPLKPITPAENERRRGSRGPRELPFLKEDGYTDVILVIEGKKLFINRCILGYCSPHFQRLLDSAVKAAADRKTKAEVKISEQSYNDMVELVTYLHPATCTEMTGKTGWKIYIVLSLFATLHVRYCPTFL